MFTWIWDRLREAFAGLVDIFQTIWDKVSLWWLSIVAMLTTVIAIFTDAFNFVKTLVLMVGAKLGLISQGPGGYVSNWSGLSNFLDMANTFFPLAEAFSMLTATFQVWAAVIVIRFGFFIRRVVLP